MSPESLSQLAKAKTTPEKSQEDLRSALEGKLLSLKPTIEEEEEKYKQALKDGTFEDKEGEPEGSGEKRKEEMQNRINSVLDRAEAMKERLDGKEPLPQSTPEISATYTHPDKKKETITLDIEKKLEDFLSFYKKTKIDLPQDFEETIKDIWERNGDQIEKAIEENGFDEMLIIPADLSIKEVSEKMKMKNGYYDGIKSSSTVQTLDGIPFKNQNTDKPHIVLVHKTQNLKDRPELKATLNTKGKDVKLDHALTLEEYIIFQRKYHEETGKYLDEEGWTWLSTKSGARLVYSSWDPGDGELYVNANALAPQRPHLGVRPSRSFF